MDKIIKNNIRLYLVLGIIILLGIVGITFALRFETFNIININTNTLEIDATIGYDTNSNGDTIQSNGNMLPIRDSSVTGVDVSDTRVLKAKFTVTGNSDNPDNTIYDIVLRDIDIPCALRTEDLKWRLYKNGTLLNSGSLSPTYDTMSGDRLVLTDIQEDLTTSTDEYTFLLWISDSCDGDITECTGVRDQSIYLNKSFSANIKVELSTKSKKSITRITGNEDSCEYTAIEVPSCNDVTYSGEVQTLVDSSSGYTLINNDGIKAGTYAISVKLNEGYKWSDGSTDNRVMSCDINKKDITVTTLDQSVVYADDISSDINDVNISGLLSNDSVSDISLSSSIADVGTGNIEINNVKIIDSNEEEVTYNYNIIKDNSGKLTITCLNIAEEPTITSYEYTGNEVTGVTGGSYVSIYGTRKAIEYGKYSVKVTPEANYCWSDYTNTTKEYNWAIASLVTYDYTTNGGISSNSVNTAVVEGDNIDLSYTATKDGWTFLGWNTDKDATIGLPSVTMGFGDMTVYAIFRKEAVTYTATTQRNLSDAIGSDNNVSCTVPAVYNNDVQDISCTVALPKNLYTLIEWTFNGWVVTSDTTTTETSGVEEETVVTISSDINIVATWKRIYTANWYYYTGGSQTSTTSDCAVYNGGTSCTFSVPNVVTSSTGIAGGSYYGVSTSVSSTTITTTYNNVNLNYYAVYSDTLTATYTKNEFVTSIGSTSNSCISYDTTDGTTYTSSGCNVTLPEINVETIYAVLGWYDITDIQVGNAGDSVTIISDIELIAKARQTTASEYTYDNSNTGVDCTDVQCMLDLLDG